MSKTLYNRLGGYDAISAVVNNLLPRLFADDWALFMGHLNDTLAHFQLVEKGRGDVVKFIESAKGDIVE
jgi:hypothetical protein